MTNSHVALPGSRRRLLAGSKLMGQCNPDTRIELTIKLRRKAPLPAVTGRPVVPMSRQEAAAKYGASEDDLAKVAAVMKRRGIDVVSENQATRSVQVAGPIKTLEDVFQVKLFEYAHASRDYRGRTGMVHVPSELDGIITGVYGLDNRRVIQRRRRLRPTGDRGSAHRGRNRRPGASSPHSSPRPMNFLPATERVRLSASWNSGVDSCPVISNFTVGRCM